MVEGTEILHWGAAPPEKQKRIILRACHHLLAGRLVAYPTETVYGLGADGLNAEAVRRIFLAKERPRNRPLLLAVSGFEMMPAVVESVPSVARRLMRSFWPGPLSLIMYRTKAVPDEVCAGGDKVGLRCPDNPVAQRLIAGLGRPITTPSANISGRPSCTTARGVMDDLAGKIACIIDAGKTPGALESTVLDVTVDPPRLLRAGAISSTDLQEVIGEVQSSGAGTGPQRNFRLIAVLLTGDEGCWSDTPDLLTAGKRRQVVVSPSSVGESVLSAVLGDAAGRIPKITWETGEADGGDDLHTIVRRLQDREVHSVYVLLPAGDDSRGWRERVKQMADEVVSYPDDLICGGERGDS